jgi:hypothetical protein
VDHCDGPRPTPSFAFLHPRNPRSSSYDLDHTLSLPSEIIFTFSVVSVIEQTNGQSWRVLKEYCIAALIAHFR